MYVINGLNIQFYIVVAINQIIMVYLCNQGLNMTFNYTFSMLSCLNIDTILPNMVCYMVYYVIKVTIFFHNQMMSSKFC